jgi:hypothetical protein
VRAIDTYDEALKKFPSSFDLAYNKYARPCCPNNPVKLTSSRARVQYELTQHPRLVAQLPGTLTDLLKTALESSRLALSLNQDNADVLLYVHSDINDFISYTAVTLIYCGAMHHGALPSFSIYADGS